MNNLQSSYDLISSKWLQLKAQEQREKVTLREKIRLWKTAFSRQRELTANSKPLSVLVADNEQRIYQRIDSLLIGDKQDFDV